MQYCRIALNLCKVLDRTGGERKATENISSDLQSEELGSETIALHVVMVHNFHPCCC